MDNKKELLREFYDSISDEDVKKFLGKCVETIPEYWFHVAASSTGKYHPDYAHGDGGLMRHSIALLRFFNRLMENSLYNVFTDREKDLLRVALLMHDSRKIGSDEDYKANKYTRFDHPLLAAEVVRNIKTKSITKEEKDIIADAIASHMGEWNTSSYSNVVLPLPENKYQKIVHTVDYLAATKEFEMKFDGVDKSNFERKVITENNGATIETYVFDFGKYDGQKLTDVIKEHPDYIKWAKEANIEREPFRTLLKKIKI